MTEKNQKANQDFRILSTKDLQPNQKELLLNAGFRIVESNFVSIVPVDFSLEELPQNVIFTSTNAVKAILSHPLVGHLKKRRIFCVGQKTGKFLRDLGFLVFMTADYGSDLALKILKNHRSEAFLFICGRKRHQALPDRLKHEVLSFKEIFVYNTLATPKKFDCNFDGVLFFSPSAVRSFCQENNLSRSTAFCIGTTTAAEAQKYADQVITATKPSIENTIAQVVKHYNQTGTYPDENCTR